MTVKGLSPHREAWEHLQASLRGEHYLSALGRSWLVKVALDKLMKDLERQRRAGSTGASQLLKSVLTTMLEFRVANCTSSFTCFTGI